jgi:hypothetical protein
MASDLIAALEEARRGLLDLSTRNRLLALPAPGRARGVLLLDEENASAILARLKAAKPFGFEAVGEAPPPKRSIKAEGITLARATAREEWQQDERLRVRLPPAELAKKLRDIIADARIAREESGVPSLFLALGALAWRDPGTVDLLSLCAYVGISMPCCTKYLFQSCCHLSSFSSVYMARA